MKKMCTDLDTPKKKVTNEIVTSDFFLSPNEVMTSLGGHNYVIISAANG
jgi:hypothetical protein